MMLGVWEGKMKELGLATRITGAHGVVHTVVGTAEGEEARRSMRCEANEVQQEAFTYIDNDRKNDLTKTCIAWCC